MSRFDTDRFQSLLSTLALGRTLVHRDVVDSTMTVARELAASGAPHGTLVLAEQQTSGRGRRGRDFYSPAGDNLYFTLVLYPGSDAVAALPLAVPVAVVEACATVCDAARIKWPNDIWIGERKVCGMLVDASTEDSRVVAYPGIGINVNGDPTVNPELAEIATSLAREAGRHVEREALLAGIVNRLEAALTVPLSLSARYRASSNTIGRRVRVQEIGGGAFEGVAESIEADGSLVVRRDDGSLETVRAADVSLRPLSTA